MVQEVSLSGRNLVFPKLKLFHEKKKVGFYHVRVTVPSDTGRTWTSMKPQ